MIKLFPKKEYKSVYEIPFKDLKEQGFRGVIFDIDNTLAKHGEPADKKNKDFFDYLRQLGFKTCLMSNNKKGRVESFASAVQSPYIFNAKKPSVKSYNKALEIMNIKKNEAVFVGDQIFTDIYGANRADVFSMLVERIDKKEEIQIVLKRIPEKIVLWLYRRRKNVQCKS